MLGLVIQEIRQTWKDGIRRITTTGRFFWYLYPCMLLMINHDKDDNFNIAFLGTIFSFVVSGLLLDILPNHISKTLFLCPLSKEERKRFILTGYWFRVGVSIAFYIIVQLVLVIFHLMTLPVMFLLHCSYVPFVITIHGMRGDWQVKEYKERKDTKYQVWNFMAIVSGAFALALSLLPISKREPYTKLDLVVILILLIIQWISSIYVRIHYFDDMLEEASVYEELKGKSKWEKAK